MIDRIYIEGEVREHPRTRAILERFSRAEHIDIERYGEVFNRRAQSFRLQKQRPALILARKFDRFVLETPAGYGIGGDRNYYFSHMLNCVYDCRYCFLQGMYQSAHYVVFVNFEDFQEEMHERLSEGPGPAYFFSGYDCDSLALDSVTGFVDAFLPWLASRPDAMFELRTKSVKIDSLRHTDPLANVIVAYSLSPAATARAFEHKAPSLRQRLRAIAELAEQGWPIGFRFDPLIHHEGWESSYEELIDQALEAVGAGTLHSVSLGPLRFPKAMYEKIVRHYPQEPLLAAQLQSERGMTSYPPSLEQEMTERCQELLVARVGSEKLFVCPSEPVSP